MASTSPTNASSSLAKPGPSTSRKGISKGAQSRRRKAARKAAESGKDSTVVSTVHVAPLSSEKDVDASSNLNPISQASFVADSKVRTTTDADISKSKPSAKTSMPVKKVASAAIVPQTTQNNTLDDGIHTGTVTTHTVRKMASGSESSSEALGEEKTDEAKAASPEPEKGNSKTTGGKLNKKRGRGGRKGLAVPSKPAVEPYVDSKVTPSPSQSWANVCSSPPTVLKAYPSPQVKTTVETTMTANQAPTTPADFPAMPLSQTGLHPDRTNALAESWPKFAATAPNSVHTTLTPLVEEVSVRFGYDKGMSSSGKPQHVPISANFSAMIPSSPPMTPKLSSISYAKTATSHPPLCPVAPPASKTNALLQPSPTLSKLSPVASSRIVEQRLDNVLLMIRPQRQRLSEGPQITLYIGTVAVTGIFKRVAMAASSVLNKHFSRNPESLDYRSPKDFVAPDAVRTLLVSWIRDDCQEFEAYAVPMQHTFAENVALLRAARVLGMESYVQHIFTAYIGYLKTELPSYDEIAIVEKNSTSPKDQLWTAMVNHLCHDRFKQLIPDPDEFATYLEGHPRLAKAMESADTYFAGAAKKKWDTNQEKWQANEDEKRTRWEKNQAEKHERIAKEKKAAISLRQKMDAKGGSGLMMATAEEAMLLRKR